jgi:hypothetical protein
MLSEEYVAMYVSFRVQLTRIEAKAGVDVAGFRALATQKGFADDGLIKSTVGAAPVVDWLKADYQLSHGDAMTIFALLKGRKKGVRI